MVIVRRWLPVGVGIGAVAGSCVLLASRVPEPAPAFTVCTRKSDICALVNPRVGRTTVIRNSRTTTEVLFSLPYATASAYLAPDAKHIVFSGGGSRQFLPKWFQSDASLVTFHGSDGLVTRARVTEFFPQVRDKAGRLVVDTSEMESFNRQLYYWGDYSGFDDRGRFAIQLLRRGRVLVDPTTGQRVP